MKPYLIYTLPFTYRSAGMMVLHKLAEALNNHFPKNVYVLSDKQGYLNLPLIDKCKKERKQCIAVYPEGVFGNPFQCGVVVRYLLNLPGTFGGPTKYEENDLLFVYSHFFNQKMQLPKDRILNTPCIDTNTFFDMGLERKGRIFYEGKGKFYSGIEAENIGVGRDFEGIEGQKKLALRLNSSELLYSFDSITAINSIARLCGCPVIVMPNDLWDKSNIQTFEEYDAGGLGYGLEDENYVLSTIDSKKIHSMYKIKESVFQDQLNNFIHITQSNSDMVKSMKSTPGRKNKNCKVSICCLTYNHSNLITYALESFLMQKTNFTFEIVIYDDCSTDGTQEILKKYKQKYPDLIKLRLGTENEFSKTGLYPFPTQLYPYAVGEYIAECDGDDYWTDPLKIQKQYDFMESHTECSMCYHRFLILENNHFIEYPAQPLNYTRNELIGYIAKKYGIHTSTKFWRNIFNDDNRKDFENFRADVPTTVLMGMHGECKFINDISPSVFRCKHENSSWTNLPAPIMKDKIQKLWNTLYELMVEKGNPLWIDIRKKFLVNKAPVNKSSKSKSSKSKSSRIVIHTARVKRNKTIEYYYNRYNNHRGSKKSI